MKQISIEEAKQWYASDDPVHDFDHVLRVYRLAERLAESEGADLEIVRAAALLHDSVGSAPGAADNSRAEHHLASAVFAGHVLRDKNWPTQRIEEVQHCIRTHRFRSQEEKPESLEAKVLFDADKLDVLGAIGVARTIAYGALEGQPIYTDPSDSFIQTGVREPGEAYSSYHEFLFKLCKVKSRLFTQSGQKLAENRHKTMVEFYQELIAEVHGER